MPSPAHRDSTPVAAPYSVGIMTMEVEGKNSELFSRRVQQATDAFKQAIAGALEVHVALHAFDGPHVTPAAGAYSPLDFLQIGMAEKLERNIHFLLIVTEVDLAASTFSYTLALPSQITNVVVLSTKRLDPGFWGDEDDERVTVDRLTAVLLHTFGHLLNLKHASDRTNVMYDFAGVDDLTVMRDLTDQQRQQMQRTLPREAHERTSSGSHWTFALHIIARDWRSSSRARCVFGIRSTGRTASSVRPAFSITSDRRAPALPPYIMGVEIGPPPDHHNVHPDWDR